VTEYKRAVLMVVFAGIFLSSLGLGTRLMDSATGLQIVFYRSVSLAIVVTSWMFYKTRIGFIEEFKQAGRIGVVASICFSGASVFLVLAVVTTTVANAMFIISLAPLFGGLFAWLLLKERVHKNTWIAFGIALLGVLVIIDGAISTAGVLGIVYAFLAVAFYGSFSVSLRWGKDQDMLPAVCLSSYLLIIALGLGLDDLWVSYKDLMICLLLGVFQLALGVLLLIQGSKHVPAAQMMVLAMLEMVLNPIWVWLGVGEVPSTATLIGGFIIFIGICYDAFGARQMQTH